MFRFIHAADIHLDSPLKGLEAHEGAPVEEVRGAARRAFVNLVDLAVEKAVDFIIIAGDLYDGDWKDYNTGLFFVKQMSRLYKAGIRTFIVSGNHDAANQITKTMPLPDNVCFFSHTSPESVEIDDLGVALHGQSYASRAVTQNLAVQYPGYIAGRFNIGLLHTSLTGREGHESYAPCTLHDLLSKGYNYWALGHVHKREVLCEDPWIIFSGNIQGRHVKETGPKGVTLVTVSDGRVTDISQHETSVLPWEICEVDLSACESDSGVYDAVREAFEQKRDLAGGRQIAIRLVLTGKSHVHASLFERMAQWTEELRGVAAGLGDIWLEKVEFRTDRKVSLEEIAGTDTPIAGLLAAIDNLEIDGDSLFELVPDMAALKSKLPPELAGDSESFLDASIGDMTELKREVKELLIARLLRHGRGR